MDTQIDQDHVTKGWPANAGLPDSSGSPNYQGGALLSGDAGALLPEGRLSGQSPAITHARQSLAVIYNSCNAFCISFCGFCLFFVLHFACQIFVFHRFFVMEVRIHEQVF